MWIWILVSWRSGQLVLANQVFLYQVTVSHSIPSVTIRSEQKDLISSWGLWPDPRPCAVPEPTAKTCFNMLYCPLAECWTKRPHSLSVPLHTILAAASVWCLRCAQASLPLLTVWYRSDSKASPFVWSAVTVAWWPAAVRSCVGFCWQKSPADTSLAAGACCVFRCCRLCYRVCRAGRLPCLFAARLQSCV